MSVDPRAALDRFVAALEAHYSAVVARRSDEDPAVDDAYEVLADACDLYDDSLRQQYGEELPFGVDDEEEDDADGEDLDDDDPLDDTIDDDDALLDGLSASE